MTARQVRWTVTTGDQEWTVMATSFFDAVRRAWKDEPPKSVGILVQGKPEDGEEHYSLGHVALQRAGYEVPEISLEEYMSALHKS
jgi:hypothetical protein